MTFGLLPVDGPCYGFHWVADPGQTEIVGHAWDGSQHLYRQREWPGVVHHVREVAPAPPPAPWPPPPECEQCWRCDAVPGDHRLGLCRECYEYLLDTDDERAP